MNDLFTQWRAASTLSHASSYNAQSTDNQSIESQSNTSSSPSLEQVAELISSSLSSLKVYVLESEITQTQNTVKSIVSQATF